MDIWITRCRKERACKHCPEKIHNLSPMVVAKVWLRRKGKSWSKEIAWHPQCWIDQGVAAMELRPIVERRGRTRLPMTDDVKIARGKVLRRRGAVLQRIHKELEREDKPSNLDRVIHFGRLLEGLRQDISVLGGVPRSWD